MSPTLPLGVPVSTETAARPNGEPLPGQTVTLVKLASEHASELWSAMNGLEGVALFTYMEQGPFDSLESYQAAIDGQAASSLDPFTYAIIDNATGKAVGHLALKNIRPADRVVQIGRVLFTPALQRSKAGTEAMYLLAKQVFDLGYRRYEYRCNSLNAKSYRMAERLGFTFEGIFRQHMIHKGRNRDSAFFSILDGEWPRIQKGFQSWLSDQNFDQDGRQLATLQECQQRAM